MKTLNESNVVKFWHEADQNVMKVEMIAGNILTLKKGDERVQDLKILDKDTKNFVKLFGKRINKGLVKGVTYHIKPKYCIIISMKNGKEYRFDSKQLNANLLDTFNFIKSLLI